MALAFPTVAMTSSARPGPYRAEPRDGRAEGPASQGERGEAPSHLTAAERRERRALSRARARLLSLFELMLRTRIFPLSGMADVCEVARLRAVRAAFSHLDLEIQAAVLLTDSVVRSPAFSKHLVEAVAPATAVDATAEEVWIELAVRLNTQAYRTWWTGRTRSHVRAVPRAWTPDAVGQASRALAAAASRRQPSQPVLEALRLLPGIGTYLAVCIVRLLGPVLDLHEACTEEAARQMSAHTSHLAWVAPFSDARTFLVEAGFFSVLSWESDMVAYLYCETSKVLRASDVIRPLGSYGPKDMSFVAAINGDTMTALLLQLETALVVPDQDSDEIRETRDLLGVSSAMRCTATLERFVSAVDGTALVTIDIV